MADVITGEAVALELPVANFPSRIAALLIDIAVQVILLLAVFIAVATTSGQLNGDFQLAAACDRAVQSGSSYTWKGDWWLADLFPYSHTSTPNRKSCFYGDVGGRPYSAITSVITASSRHPGGVNVAFCDGSVRFIKNSVAPQTWQAIGTVNGGEVLSSDAY